jgi:predicted transcriptional regulator
MTKSAVITTRVSEETLALIDKVARAHGRSRARIIAQAVERFAEQESEFLRYLKEGEDAIYAGQSYSQEQLEAWFAARMRGEGPR